MWTLEVRREKLCLKFALKALKSQKFSSWFSVNQTEVNTRSEKLPLRNIKGRTKRFRTSPIPYLTELLNAHLPKHTKEVEANIQTFVSMLEHWTIPLRDRRDWLITQDWPSMNMYKWIIGKRHVVESTPCIKAMFNPMISCSHRLDYLRQIKHPIILFCTLCEFNCFFEFTFR